MTELTWKQQASLLQIREVKLGYHEPWYKRHFFCKKGGHLVRQEDAIWSFGKEPRLICPIHHMQLRTRRLRRAGEKEDVRKRIDC